MATLALAVCASAPAAAETMRLRVAWGGGADRACEGRATVSEGSIVDFSPLGIEADEPGSMWLEDGRLVFRQRSARAYDGMDMLVVAPLTAKFQVQLAAPGQQGSTHQIEVSLGELVDGVSSTDLDTQGNRLVIRRTPDDRLQVDVKHPSLVFAPGEVLEFDLVPHLLGVEPEGRLRIGVTLLASRSSQVLSTREEIVTVGAQSPPIPQELRLPEKEGVYEVVVSATRTPMLQLPQSGRIPMNLGRPLAQRKIQVLVLEPNASHLPSPSSIKSTTVVEIDPANSNWWERYAKLPHMRRFGRLWKGALGSGNTQTVRHPLGVLVQLAPAANPGDVSWEAYALPIDLPGQPHFLEIEYPSDKPQTMGISIVEPNAMGAVLPVGLDSGVDLADEVIDSAETPKMLKHRMVFWPKTKAPLVLITNRRPKTPAIYGKIRVIHGGPNLPRAFPADSPPPERLLAAYLDRPLFPQNFSANDAPGPMSERGVDDWRTFHEGGTRLVEYLHYAGFGGLMVAALADGSALYPSKILESTPRYDTGVFFETGQDPVRKDVLEMLLRLFDRERLTLIPSLEFATPLPELEALLRAAGPEAEGLVWIGSDGTTMPEITSSPDGRAPYYNVLHPRVQDALLRVVRELVARYSAHSSFAGVAVQLSAAGYAQLPGPDWGLDDVTIARFQRDTRIRVPGEGPRRFADRAAFLASQCSQEWLQWRADQLARFYQRIYTELSSARPDARLYLAGANLFDGDDWRRELQPALPQRLTMAQALLRTGIDVRRFQPQGGIVLLRPERIQPPWSLGKQATALEVRHMTDADRYFDSQPLPGELFFHKPQETRVPSFDEKSPYRPCHTWLATLAVPSAQQNRRRFVHSLATLDSQVLFDGGWQLSLGQEESLRDLVAAYRRLPALRFQRLVEQPGTPSMQPVSVRYAVKDKHTYLYLVNDAPFPSTVRLAMPVPAGCQIEELSGMRQIAQAVRDAEGTSWTVELLPYDLIAVRIAAPNVALGRVQVSWPKRVQEAMQARLTDLGDRAASLRNPPVLETLENSGFERTPTAAAPIPGWTSAAQPGTSVSLDEREKHGGRYSAKLSSQGPPVTLVSSPFTPPTTGRLTMSVWIRGSDAAQASPLRLSVVGQHEGREFFRFAELGDKTAPRLGPAWGPVVVQVNDLPLDGLASLQVRVDLLARGDVWLDDLQLCGLAFSNAERVELFKLIAPAEVKLERGEVGDCLRLLDNYWSRFLLTNVPISPAATVRRPEPSRTTASPTPPAPQRSAGLMDRLKSMVPDKLRF